MGFDTSIYSQIKPVELQNPLTQALQVAQLQGAQSQNRLADLAFGEKQRAIADDARMRDILAKNGGDLKAAQGALMSGGFYKPALEIGSKLVEQQEKQGKIDKQNFELATGRYDYYKKTLGALAQEPNLSKDMVIEAGQHLVQQGILPMAMYQGAIGNLPDDPAQLRAKLMQGVKSQLTPEQMLTVFAPKPTQIDNGQQISFKDTNPNSPTFGQMIGGAPVQKLQSPDSKASVAASRENAAATRAVAASNVEAAKIKSDREAEMKLADDYRAQSKEFGQAASAYKQISATLADATKSPAATLAAATKFMKILDPGSVVRESELGMALAASGVIDRATNYINILQRGKVLTPTQAADFKNISDKMYQAAQQVQRSIDADYKAKAKAYKLRPEMVIQELGQGGDVMKQADAILGL